MGTRRQQDPAPSEGAPDLAAALEIAARFLATRPRTRWELEGRLRRARADAGVIDACLAELARLGYLNDTGFVRWWAEQRDRHAPRGRRLVEAELRQRGIGRELLDAMRGDELAEPALGGDGLPASEAERARVALERHLRGRPMPTDPRELQRLLAFLVRRGFDPDTARAALREAVRAERPDP